MTNQTTQTMPAIEAAVNAGLASYHGVKTFSSEVRLRLALEATARAMLAAAPAASGVDTSTNEAWAARAQEKIEAMEAATGGEDDMCPNCVTPWKCNGLHESTGGASVSERARELVKRWREYAAGTKKYAMGDYESGCAAEQNRCADELESLLSGGSHA